MQREIIDKDTFTYKNPLHRLYKNSFLDKLEEKVAYKAYLESQMKVLGIHPMQQLLAKESYCLKKKSNYIEKLSLGLLSQDNVFKLYEWEEDNILRKLRLLKYVQRSKFGMRTLFCSQFRNYRGTCVDSKGTHMLTKSIRSSKTHCSCNKRLPPRVSLFDSMMGYLGKVEWPAACETILICQDVTVNIYDETDTMVYQIKKPATNLISLFGNYPWTFFFQQDFKVRGVGPKEAEVVAIVRRQYSRFVKEKCSNGAHYFVKFKDKSLTWSERALILEAI